MATFAELLLPVGLPVDRDDVEEALLEAFGDGAGITGAGTGPHGSNLDLEFPDATRREDLIDTMRQVLDLHGVVGGRVRFEDREEWISL